MIVGVDASNISGGGGLTHLVELLRSADPTRHGFSRIVVWASCKTLDRLADRDWLDKRTDDVLQKGFVERALWQRRRLRALVERERCAVLFVPGGSFATTFRPVVTMSRNMLPFEMTELLRFGFSATTLKLLALRFVQRRSFRLANGVVFLSEYARRAVQALTGRLAGAVAVIPHGVDASFRQPPRPPRALSDCSPDDPFRWLYVSTIDAYKHPWYVAEAVAQLRGEGLPVAVDFVGHGSGRWLARLTRVLDRHDPERRYLRHLGGVDHRSLPELYRRADGFVYASSCENLPNVLLEAMSAGLPIASSDRGPMPEVLGEAGDYFDPLDVGSIARTLSRQLHDPAHRGRIARAAYQAAGGYSWERCADETFAFLAVASRVAA